MIIQSQRVWIAGQFIPAQLEVEGEKIVSVLAYGTKKADKDYGEMRLLMCIQMERMDLIPMMQNQRGCVIG